jgi:hypothetical protein
MHILRVLFGILLSGTIGWISLFVFHFIKITRQFEAFEETASDGEFATLVHSVEAAAYNIDGGGSALFLAAGIAGVLLSEIFKTRLFLFYAGATGALTALFAAALWQQSNAGNAQTAAALAMAGFVAGGVYWIIAVPSAPRG